MWRALDTAHLSRRRLGRIAAAMSLASRVAVERSGRVRGAAQEGLQMRVADVNTTDIAAAIRLGCETMSRVFNADDDDIPFFHSTVWPHAELGFNDSHSESHVPGRHLNALLTAEAVAGLGLTIPDGVIEKHARAAFFSYSGAAPVPLNRDRIGGKLIRFLPHNIREGFHALYALTRYRQSDHAQTLAEASIVTINRTWEPNRGWDREELEDRLGLWLVEWNGPFISGIARAIGPLVKYHRATGSEAALELATRIKDRVIERFFLAEGTLDRSTMGTHTHSLTCVMSSLAQLAELTGDVTLLGTAKAFYDNGLKEIADPLGWSIENCSDGAIPDRGEANNTGDILETALILGRNGYPAYYHEAERILRGHLLPSQLRDISFIVDPPNPSGEDGKRDVAQRHRGAFGFPAPYGHHPIDASTISFNMDIVGGAVASLVEAYQEIVRSDEQGHWVNLLFDHETDALRVESPYTHQAFVIEMKQPGPLRVRIPPWANEVTVNVEGGADAQVREEAYLVIPQPPLHRPLTINLLLPENDLVLAHRTRSIRVRLRGDEVVAMDNFGAPLTFFEPY